MLSATTTTHLNRLSNPRKLGLGLLLPLGIENLFRFLYLNVFLLNRLIIFSLLYGEVWTSENVGVHLLEKNVDV